MMEVGEISSTGLVSEPQTVLADRELALKLERKEWEAERAWLTSTKTTYFQNIQSLTEELADLRCKLVKAESDHGAKIETMRREREELASEVDNLKLVVNSSEAQLADSRKDFAEKMKSGIKQRSQLEAELHLQKTISETLQNNIEALKNEVRESRQDLLRAETVVEDLQKRASSQELQLQQREAELEVKLQEKDDIIEAKVRALKSITMEHYPESGHSSVLSGLGESTEILKSQKSSTDLYEEVLDLRKKLIQKQSEVDYHVQRFTDLLKEVQRRPFEVETERQQWEQANVERVNQIEGQLEEQQTIIRSLKEHINILQKRETELHTHNTMLIAQFASDFLPTYYGDEELNEADVKKKLTSVQDLISDNIRLQTQVQELQNKLNEELPAVEFHAIQSQLQLAADELAKCKQEVEQGKVAVARLETNADFYRQKYEELAFDENGVEKSLTTMIDVCDVTMSNDQTKSGIKSTKPRSKLDYEVEMHKLRCELASVTENLSMIKDETKRRGKAHDELVLQKNELISQLYSSKEALELKVQAQTSILEKMEKRLNELDKLNRKLDEQKQKAVTEHRVIKTKVDGMQSRYNQMEAENKTYVTLKRTLETELNSNIQELNKLRTSVQHLQANESISQTISGALNEFREAYTKLDSAQLIETKEQLKNVCEENATMTTFVKSMHIQQMFAMDKLKTALADAQLQRDNNAERCENLDQQLNVLQLEHADLKDRYELLSKQMNEIDSSDVSLESCRKQIQILRNKIAYLERTSTEANSRAEGWKIKLDMAEQQFTTFKKLAESMESNLKQNEEQGMRERNLLQQKLEQTVSELRDREATLDHLRAQISELQNTNTNREAKSEETIREWRTRVISMEEEKDAFAKKVDNLHAELIASRAKADEIQNTIQEQAAALETLQVEKEQLDAVVEEYTNQVEQLQIENTNLQERVQDVQNIASEMKQSLESDNEALREQVAVYEKAALSSQGANRCVHDTLSNLIDRVSADTDQIPLQLPVPSLMSHEDANRAVQIIERLRRERNEEAQRRLQGLTELQQGATSTTGNSTDTIPLPTFNATIAKLNAQIEGLRQKAVQKSFYKIYFKKNE